MNDADPPNEAAEPAEQAPFRTAPREKSRRAFMQTLSRSARW